MTICKLFEDDGCHRVIVRHSSLSVVKRVISIIFCAKDASNENIHKHYFLIEPSFPVVIHYIDILIVRLHHTSQGLKEREEIRVLQSK